MITLIAGARPNFMKIAPLVSALGEVNLPWRLVHTGQHYDRQMSETFFDELGIPQPHVNLGVGSGSHIAQTTEVMRRLETEFTQHRPACVVVVGDVNSTLAAALTANKLGIPVAHVEAGLRSYDRSMPEEINRVLTDAIADLLFTSEPSGDANLLREGIPADRIHQVGNVMIDTLRTHLEAARHRKAYEQHGLNRGEYAVLTMHRPSNVDSRERLAAILRAVHDLSQKLPILFPLHPRTSARLDEFEYRNSRDMNGYRACAPIGYIDMLSLIEGARLVLTDSGGLQEETTALRVPCLTIRENTERPITIEQGSNRLVGWQTEDLTQAADEVLNGPQRTGQVPDNWDGNAATRIADCLQKYV